MKAVLALFLSMACASAKPRDFATRKVSELEKKYVEDCERHAEPHGYYGAFLEPCEFSFFDSPQDPCDPGSMMVSRTPMNWVLNLTDHFKKDDWDKVDWDNTDWEEIARDKVMLWPDQCVGMEPKCYKVTDPAIQPTLTKLIQDIPVDATHVQVDCRTDAVALGRTLYAISDSVNDLFPFFVVGCVTLVLISIAILGCLSCGCVYLFNELRSRIIRNADSVDIDHKGVYVAVEDSEANTKNFK